MKKPLIVCYSWPNSSTERIAKKFQNIADDELLKIDTWTQSVKGTVARRKL